jgi:hypothetical protein
MFSYFLRGYANQAILMYVPKLGFSVMFCLMIHCMR